MIIKNGQHIKRYLPIPCGNTEYVMMRPDKNQLYIGRKGNPDFIEVRENNKTIKTINVNDIAEIFFI